MDNKKTENNDINLSQINWNKLDIESFSKLSEDLNFDIKTNKSKLKKELAKKIIVINIDNKKYELKYSDYSRYKSLKSSKSKENFKNFIKQHYTPIVEI